MHFVFIGLTGIVIYLLSVPLNEQFVETPVAIQAGSDSLHGTLTLPDSINHPPAVLVISGSGPTNRDGNSTVLNGKNNSLRLLAHDLAKSGIASVRYDKRGIGESTRAASYTEEGAIREDLMVFDDFVADAIAWLKFMIFDDRLGAVFVAGHSEGSLIAMIAAGTLEPQLAGLISIAGPGRGLDSILIEQLTEQAPFLLPSALPVLDSLKAGQRVDSVNVFLQAIFRPSVQPFLINMLQYDPARIFESLELPSLVIGGTTDIQISRKDIRRLSESRPDAELLVIDGMNHILKDAPEDRLPNLATYSQPELPLSEDLIPGILDFIHRAKENSREK